MKAQLTGMRGVYLVAAELSRLGFIATTTSRSAMAADILVTDQACKRPFTVQVKTNAGIATPGSFWLVGKHTPVSDTHVYVLVNLDPREHRGVPDYFVVPSAALKTKVWHDKGKNADFYSVALKDVLEYRDKWDIFGDPQAELKIEEGSVSKEVESPDEVTAVRD